MFGILGISDLVGDVFESDLDVLEVGHDVGSAELDGSQLGDVLTDLGDGFELGCAENHHATSTGSLADFEHFPATEAVKFERVFDLFRDGFGIVLDVNCAWFAHGRGRMSSVHPKGSPFILAQQSFRGFLAAAGIQHQQPRVRLSPVCGS